MRATRAALRENGAACRQRGSLSGGILSNAPLHFICSPRGVSSSLILIFLTFTALFTLTNSHTSINYHRGVEPTEEGFVRLRKHHPSTRNLVRRGVSTSRDNVPFGTVKEIAPVDPDHKIYMLFPLPINVGNQAKNPFKLSIPSVEPVVDIAIEEVYRKGYVPYGSFDISFQDSKMSDAHGPNVAIDALVRNKLDVIIGYAFVYALAPVARMSPFWRDKDSVGIPVITSIGLTSNLDDRNEYSLMTRISGPYKVVKDAVSSLFERFNWTRAIYMFHELRHGNPDLSLPVGECYLLMASIRMKLQKMSAVPMEHNYFLFNEQKSNRTTYTDYLQRSSMQSNG